MHCAATAADEALLQELSPLGWEHINLIDDYLVMEHSTDWAEEEFRQATLGDIRLIARLVEMARVLGAQPNATAAQMQQMEMTQMKEQVDGQSHESDSALPGTSDGVSRKSKDAFFPL